MKAIDVVVGVTAFFILNPAFAGDASQAEQFSNLDKDNDGYVSINEAEGHLDMLRHWVDIDRDTNGKLEFSEFSAFESKTEEDTEKAKTYVPMMDEESYDLGAAPM